MNNNRLLIGGAAMLLLLTDWTTTLGLFGGALMILGVGILMTEELDAYLQRRS